MTCILFLGSWRTVNFGGLVVLGPDETAGPGELGWPGKPDCPGDSGA